jgi:DNA-binding NarL/FixJ family response regulator
VLLLVRAGLANKQIARKLEISERTVKAHLTNVFQRLGVSDRTQAALWASQHLN